MLMAREQTIDSPLKKGVRGLFPMDRQLHRNLFDTFLYNPLTPFFKGESREGSYSFTGPKR